MYDTWHVSIAGDDLNEGSEKAPFRTVSRAAEKAEYGDTVIIHGGTYREWVSPRNGGQNESTLITYRAAEGEHVVITGSEPVTGWTRHEGTVWKTVIDNGIFKDGNPFATRLWGDWYIMPVDRELHTAEVYLDGRTLFEARDLASVITPDLDATGYVPDFFPKQPERADQDLLPYPWHAEVKDDVTELYVNFQELDPAKENIEITVRPFCFFPRETGRDFIRVKGIEFCHAATQWAPPTAFQAGMVGPHWSKGWVIEDCHLHHTKCCAISLGKERSTGHNEAFSGFRKPGYQYQFEVVCRALHIGWDRKTIGSHIVKNNIIHDCGQCGIVGHLGSAFCEICGNEIWNIATRHEFFGHEIGGIKMHAAIDTEVRENLIHDCTLGTWLDWELQGVRVTRNVYWNNDRDIYAEVSHGPYIIDNNIFASEYNVDDHSQGGAYVHNLFAGASHQKPILDRSTPYHYAHSTEMQGTAFIYGGDDRMVNNLFFANGPCKAPYFFGTAHFDAHPSSMEEYLELTNADVTNDHSKFFDIPQPMYIEGNAYAGAPSYRAEKDATVSERSGSVKIVREDGHTYAEIFLPEDAAISGRKPVNSGDFEAPRITECRFEDRFGNPIEFTTDLIGEERAGEILAGPLASLRSGVHRILVK